MAKPVTVEVAYALPGRQWLLAVTLAEGSTVGQAIAQSNIADRVAQLVLSNDNVGIYGQPCSLDRVVRDGDRIEIYRPLDQDPKTLRRLRAQQQAEASKRVTKP